MQHQVSLQTFLHKDLWSLVFPSSSNYIIPELIFENKSKWLTRTEIQYVLTQPRSGLRFANMLATPGKIGSQLHSPRGSIYTTIRELGPKIPYYRRNYGSQFPNGCICGPSGSPKLAWSSIQTSLQQDSNLQRAPCQVMALFAGFRGLGFRVLLDSNLDP